MQGPSPHHTSVGHFQRKNTSKVVSAILLKIGWKNGIFN
jgi:hypothetical protein